VKVTIYEIYKRLLRKYLQQLRHSDLHSFYTYFTFRVFNAVTLTQSTVDCLNLVLNIRRNVFSEMHYLRKQYQILRLFSVGDIDVKRLCMSMSRYQNAV
jgi:hypothetical protein